MFGIFKRQPKFNSPEEKLRHKMLKQIEYRALAAFKKSPMRGTHAEGLVLIQEINDAKEFYTSRSISVSKDYGVSRENTIKIINECAKVVYKQLIE